jgi:hypothetical protein
LMMRRGWIPSPPHTHTVLSFAISLLWGIFLSESQQVMPQKIICRLSLCQCFSVCRTVNMRSSGDALKLLQPLCLINPQLGASSNQRCSAYVDLAWEIPKQQLLSTNSLIPWECTKQSNQRCLLWLHKAQGSD